MANSSDWIAALQDSAQTNSSGPSWLESVGDSVGFVERYPTTPGNHQGASAEPGAVPEQDAIAQAFAEGEAAGRAATEVESAKATEHQRKLRLAFRELDQAAIDALAGELSNTVLALCEQVMAAHAIDRDALAARCGEAAVRIGSVASDLTLRLNPQDLAMLGDDFADTWTVEVDATLERGNLRLESEDGAVCDGPREWHRAIAVALGA